MTTNGVATADAAAVPATGDRPGPGFWIGLIVGGAVMAFGVRGVFMDSRGTRPVALAGWIVGADLVHDLVIAPIAVAVGWTIGRLVPRGWRTPITTGLVATGVVLVVAWPALRGYGRAVVPDNPSVQPLAYGTAVAWVLGAVWIGVAIWLVIRWWGARSRR
ncbi:MAG: hypothetical protein JJE46_02090 [Acidimicrobiia bacterium]|nr:hypothetical protein [Acidimicrobiia bacterium]